MIDSGRATDAPAEVTDRRSRVAALGGRVVPTTALIAQTLSEDWLVEIEVIAAG